MCVIWHVSFAVPVSVSRARLVGTPHAYQGDHSHSWALWVSTRSRGPATGSPARYCKSVCRLYRAEGLSLRHKRQWRNKSARLRQPRHLVTTINEIWSMDFVADALFDGRRLRVLTVVENYTLECIAIEVGQSLKGEHGRRSTSSFCKTIVPFETRDRSNRSSTSRPRCLTWRLAIRCASA